MSEESAVISTMDQNSPRLSAFLPADVARRQSNLSTNIQGACRRRSTVNELHPVPSNIAGNTAEYTYSRKWSTASNQSCVDRKSTIMSTRQSTGVKISVIQPSLSRSRHKPIWKKWYHLITPHSAKIRLRVICFQRARMILRGSLIP